jgi:hypothetical protein
VLEFAKGQVVSVFMGSYYSLQLVDADTGPIHIPGTKLEL